MKQIPSLAEVREWRDRAAADNRRRFEQQLDPMDCALSTWADSSTIGLCSFVEALYEQGEEYGVDGPVAVFRRLVAEDGEVVPAKLVRVYDKWKYCEVLKWVVEDAGWVSRLGRKWLPSGSRSRVLKQLGLREVRWAAKVTCYDSSCAFVGAPVGYGAAQTPDIEWIEAVEKEVA